MKNLSVFSLSLVAVLAITTSALADKPEMKGLKSGPQMGDRIGAFYVTKVAGAEDDGVSEGQNLCYRCRNGANPQVIVFTRSNNAQVQQLVSRLDKAIMENESSKLRVFVNVLGEDKEDVTQACEKLAMTSKAKNVPFVVPNEFENGPDNYGINAKAEVTVTLASDAGVKASHAVMKADQLNVDAVLSDIAKIIN